MVCQNYFKRNIKRDLNDILNVCKRKVKGILKEYSRYSHVLLKGTLNDILTGILPGILKVYVYIERIVKANKSIFSTSSKWYSKGRF